MLEFVKNVSTIYPIFEKKKKMDVGFLKKKIIKKSFFILKKRKKKCKINNFFNF